MMILMVLLFSQSVTCQSSQNSDSIGRSGANSASPSPPPSPSPSTLMPKNLQKIGNLFEEKIHGDRTDAKLAEELIKINGDETGRSHKRKAKSLAFYPYYLPQVVPYGPPPGYFHPQNKDFENAYTTEWLSRTEPFKRNTALLDSPTYYIRLPPNPYAFVPGLGYVSRPPALSDPEVYESNKHETTVSTGNDLYHDPFYRLPINFVSNGKPTSVYQLANDHQIAAKPDANFINLNKGPYVFNGKPSEIFLVAQIYNALYGDELNHFYP